MRIGLAIETDRPGGAETMMLELARELQARGQEVFALGPTGGEGWLTGRFEDLGIRRDLVVFRRPFGLGSVSEIASVIRRRRLDVLHSHDFMMAVCGALGARRAGCRHLITMHGGPYYATKPRRRFALRVAGALSSHTVAVSEAFRRTLARSLLAPVASIDVVHNGVAAVSGSGDRVRADLGLGRDDVLLLAVGSLYPVKGHSVLLEAVSRLSATSAGIPARDRPGRVERVVVAIAGTGGEEASLRARVSALGIEPRVHLLGYRSDVPDLLAAADVFVMPSLSEGLPMAMIEAMLAGKAIVASDVGGIGELLPDPSFGVLIPPSDAEALAAELVELIRDPVRRERLGSAARARALKHFTAAAMTDRYLSMYSD